MFTISPDITKSEDGKVTDFRYLDNILIFRGAPPVKEGDAEPGWRVTAETHCETTLPDGTVIDRPVGRVTVDLADLLTPGRVADPELAALVPVAYATVRETLVRAMLGTLFKA